jgi:hypothetical protein
MKRTKYMAMLIAIMGLVIVVMGGAYLGIAFQKNALVTDSLRAQKITLGLTPDQIAAGKLVDDGPTAMVAAQTLNEHLGKIAPTYGDLMASNTKTAGKFDPTNPSNITYGQGLTMETGFNLAVLTFGFIQETMVTGVALIIIGLVIGLLGLTILGLAKKQA